MKNEVSVRQGEREKWEKGKNVFYTESGKKRVKKPFPSFHFSLFPPYTRFTPFG
jgi:hypothetical protein